VILVFTVLIYTPILVQSQRFNNVTSEILPQSNQNYFDKNNQQSCNNCDNFDIQNNSRNDQPPTLTETSLTQKNHNIKILLPQNQPNEPKNPAITDISMSEQQTTPEEIIVWPDNIFIDFSHLKNFDKILHSNLTNFEILNNSENIPNETIIIPSQTIYDMEISKHFYPFIFQGGIVENNGQNDQNNAQNNNPQFDHYHRPVIYILNG
jgi:hypothetical protein